MEIDWSKAPEWATKHGLYALENKIFEAWLGDDKYQFILSSNSYPYGGKCKCDQNPLKSEFSHVTIRPVTNQQSTKWSGEGLPPVGLDIQVRHELYGWIGAQVVGQDGEAAIVRTNDGYAGVFPHQMRPIRTPEQIAADEREAAIDQMVADTQAAHGWTEAFGMLHDKGYRKEQK